MTAPGLDAVWADRALVGRAACRAASDRVDAWLAELFETAGGGSEAGLALVAVGGYGRRELSPGSDLDLLLLHDRSVRVDGIAEALWYPIWDTGLKLGHAVRTTRDALGLAASDLDTATSLLSARCVAGSASLVEDLAAGAVEQWRRKARRNIPELAARIEERHAVAGEVAFLLEPDLKEGRGGLRDVHGIRWGQQAMPLMLDLSDESSVADAYSILLGARVELHRHTGKALDRLHLQDQDAVAAALGLPGGADELMARVAAAARTIAWVSDDTWYRLTEAVRPKRRWGRRPETVAPDVLLRDGEIALAADADPAREPVLALRVAAAAAEARARIERRTLDRLEASVPVFPDPWPDGARDELVRVLRSGRAAIDVLESIDQRGLMVRVLPEWEAVRSHPQRNAYHQFTVDRHLCEAAANAAALTDRVARPDLLVVGAWLHDLGKGYPGDHTEVGIGLVRSIAHRMGFPGEDVDRLCAMVRHHLLLPDVATRRDLDDPATIDFVATAVEDGVTLDLLDALTEADSIATGPAAWGSWKQSLVRQLVSRVHTVLDGAPSGQVATESSPDPEYVKHMARGETVVVRSDDRLVVIAPDEPGVFHQVAAGLALAGATVRSATIHSDDAGMICDEFEIAPATGGELDWGRIERTVLRALEGRIALDARLAERARAYDGRTKGPPLLAEPKITFDNEMVTGATVIEVHAPDATGLLARLAKTMSDLGLDIRRARVQTLGPSVVDAFYVVDRQGRPVRDGSYLEEIERALHHALERE